MYPCDSTNVIQYNFYFSKKTLRIIELKGNRTIFVSFDDTLIIDVNVLSWRSIGGWKPNSIVNITNNACSNVKKILGNVWNTLFKSFLVFNTK
ncbi:unnamed protein product [Aphis gossypii]|uniref:Uncharacterized protein n=1 Tax=Aphis gossypii TaxID=80765 RepID=A0A9P0JCH2_APHGO|nr:unnamed protein product [Aphis gossypii]